MSASAVTVAVTSVSPASRVNVGVTPPFSLPLASWTA